MAIKLNPISYDTALAATIYTRRIGQKAKQLMKAGKATNIETETISYMEENGIKFKNGLVGNIIEFAKTFNKFKNPSFYDNFITNA